jgi:two-component system, OmpR family, sensor kinase
VMAAVLAAAGAFLYAQFRGDLDSQLDAALKTEALSAVALADVGRLRAIDQTAGVALVQVYDADGRIIASSTKARGRRLLTAAEAVRATRRTLQIDRRRLASESVRVRAVPARTGNGTPRSLAVGDSLARRDHELARLRDLLLIAGPLALLLASIAGYEVARAALIPVDRMRRRSERITESALSERLPVSTPADEIGALGTTLNTMLDRVEAAVARERRLVSDASHELRTPLTTLRAEVELAMRGDRSPQELRAALESAAEEARRMSRLADDLLVLARADQGRLPLNSEPLAARELLEAAAQRARAAAQVRGRRIVVSDGGSNEAVVRADRDRTAQVLDNLITNALHYGEGTIGLSAKRSGEVVELHVTDEGEGFPEEVIGRPFERFARGSQARATETGSGLGLALVEAVAAAHGGWAQARNRPEGGADVWIALPCGQVSRSR